MIFSTALVLSAVTSVLAINGGSTNAKRASKLYARAHASNPNSGVEAWLEFYGSTDGEPTWIKVGGVKGLTNAMGGPFGYHIHTNPVPADGNCNGTLAHLDPLNATQGFVCNPAFPQYCEEGDLSGKHGKLNATDDGTIPAFWYNDDRVRFFPQSHSILGRSIVIHAANKTRLACGNITSQLDGTENSQGEATNQPSNYVKDYPTVALVQPTPTVIPFNGTVMPDPAVIAALPYPLPVPALSLAEALNVKLGSITHSVKFANSEHTITQPNEEKVDGAGPFS